MNSTEANLLPLFNCWTPCLSIEQLKHHHDLKYNMREKTILGLISDSSVFSWYSFNHSIRMFYWLERRKISPWCSPHTYTTGAYGQWTFSRKITQCKSIVNIFNLFFSPRNAPLNIYVSIPATLPLGTVIESLWRDHELRTSCQFLEQPSICSRHDIFTIEVTLRYVVFDSSVPPTKVNRPWCEFQLLPTKYRSLSPSVPPGRARILNIGTNQSEREGNG